MTSTYQIFGTYSSEKSNKKVSMFHANLQKRGKKLL